MNTPAPLTHVQTSPPRVATITDAETDALQREVFDLVRARLLDAIGPDGDFEITVRRRAADPDGRPSLFDETVADLIAWDVAARLVDPAVPNRARLTD